MTVALLCPLIRIDLKKRRKLYTYNFTSCSLFFFFIFITINAMVWDENIAVEDPFVQLGILKGKVGLEFVIGNTDIDI